MGGAGLCPPDRVEHIPLEIWERTQEAISSAVAKANIQPGDIAAVGVTNQRETTVVWNRRTGQPYYNAIVWQDTRTKDICTSLTSVLGQDRFRSKTGLPLTTYFSGPKIKWILDNIAPVRADVERGEALFGTIDTWLIWWLTGGPKGGSHVLGDQQAPLVGQTCFQPGEAKNTYGIACFVLLHKGIQPVPSRHGLLTTVAYKFEDQPAVYALEKARSLPRAR